MNKEQHERILFTTLKKWFPTEEEAYLKRVAQAQLTRFEVAMELWMEEREQGVVDTPVEAPHNVKPNFRRPAPEPNPEPVHTLPPPPQGASLIIDPNSKKAKETMEGKARAKAVPLRLPARPKNVQAPNAGTPKKYWSQGDLRDYLDANTPEFIQVMVDGRDQPVILARDIQVQLGPDTVKVFYGIGDTVQPTVSQQNSPHLGETLQAVAIDIPVFKTFDCYTQFPDLDTAMAEMHEQAKLQFRPRPENIPSHTPRQTGPLTFRMPDPNKPNDPKANPHDDVGEMRNPLNGKVW